jgi:glutamate formiminotransferase / formiminotetrahydrofolate cyclodeaminase
MDQILECVPNFSEGRNPLIIREITFAIESVTGVKLLDVSSGRATNRTVVTFAGDPEAVVEAAFRGIQKAAQLIDMRRHRGEHPRFGATDVCPLVPVANITMEETVKYAVQLAERVGTELSVPVYCYEFAAFSEERRSLASCRIGGYEGLQKRFLTERWKPDFGPAQWSEKVAKTGAVAIGARNFLIAYNINLNTTSTQLAQSIALDIRESGRLKRDGGKDSGKVLTDDDGKPLRIPGSLNKTRALGWFIEEFGIAQVSMNLTDISVTPVHTAFEEVVVKAGERGVRVTGSELVGLIPLQAMIDAGKYFLHKQKRPSGIPDEQIIKIAIRSLGLDELQPFDPQKKIIEYLLREEEGERLTDKTLARFVADTSMESLAPGGGSVSAAIGAMGAALGGMVANMSVLKSGWEDRWQEFSEWAEKATQYYTLMLQCVEEDAEAFRRLNHVMKLPQSDEQEKKFRAEAVKAASAEAIQVPLKVMQLSYKAMDVLKAMVESGNPALVSDAGVGAIAARAAVESGFLSIKINAVNDHNNPHMNRILEQAAQLVSAAREKESEILRITDEKINGLKQQGV